MNFPETNAAGARDQTGRSVLILGGTGTISARAAASTPEEWREFAARNAELAAALSAARA